MILPVRPNHKLTTGEKPPVRVAFQANPYTEPWKVLTFLPAPGVPTTLGTGSAGTSAGSGSSNAASGTPASGVASSPTLSTVAGSFNWKTLLSIGLIGVTVVLIFKFFRKKKK